MKRLSSLLTLTFAPLLAQGSFFGEARAAQTKACESEATPEINGATLHYVECGAGAPLVVVHGSLGDLRNFSAQLEAFARSFRVIAYSRRFSPPNAPARATDAYALSTHVADLRVLVKELKATPARLVASSYGAYIALAFALEHPDLVRSPGSGRAAHPSSPVSHVSMRGCQTVVARTSHRASTESVRERQSRGRSAAVPGRNRWAWLLR